MGLWLLDLSLNLVVVSGIALSVLVSSVPSTSSFQVCRCENTDDDDDDDDDDFDDNTVISSSSEETGGDDEVYEEFELSSGRRTTYGDTPLKKGMVLLSNQNR